MAGGVVRRRGCSSCSKDDFLPEESFQSWQNYGKAWSQIGLRLKDRILTRSLDDAEIHEMQAQSQHQMKKTLNWWDLIWFGIGAVIGSGIFVLTGLEANQVAGPAVVLSYVVSGVSAMLSVFCYTEFAVEIPVAGGSFAYLRYNNLDPIAVAVVFIVGILAVKSTKGSSRVNYIASIVHVIVIAFIIVAGFTHIDVKNYKPFAPFGARGVFKASAVLYFAYVGFDAVATMAEETKNPGRDIPIGLVWSMIICTVAYCLMAVTLCLMQPYTKIDQNAAYPIAFQAVGMGWAKYLVAAGALKGMTTVLLVSAVGQARYLTHIARTHMVPPWLANVNEKTGTPVNATVVMLVATAIIAFFAKLDILSNLLSISTLFIFMLVAVALLVRRYYVSGVTTNADRNKLIGCLTLLVGSSAVTAIYWATSDGWIAYAITVPVWFISTLGLRVLVPHARDPKLWGVPLVPWLPSASIAINIFLLGSIDGASFVRFIVWTLILFTYYLFFGLHASYDMAQESLKNKNDPTSLKKIEEGDATLATTTSRNEQAT